MGLTESPAFAGSLLRPHRCVTRAGDRGGADRQVIRQL